MSKRHIFGGHRLISSLQLADQPGVREAVWARLRQEALTAIGERFGGKQFANAMCGIKSWTEYSEPFRDGFYSILPARDCPIVLRLEVSLSTELPE